MDTCLALPVWVSPYCPSFPPMSTVRYTARMAAQPFSVGVIGYVPTPQGEQPRYWDDRKLTKDAQALADEIVKTKGCTEVELVPLKTSAALEAWRQEHGYGI